MKEDQFGLNISKEDVNKYLAQLILESGIGDFFKEQFKEVVNDSLRGWDNPVKNFVRSTVIQYVGEELQKSPYKEMILEKLRESVTEETINRIVSEGMRAFQRSIENN